MVFSLWIFYFGALVCSGLMNYALPHRVHNEVSVMLARHEFAACAASPVTLDVVLTERSHWEADIEIPEWSEDLIRPMSEAWAQQTSTLDDLLESMAGAGHGVAALSFYLGLPEADVRQRAAWLGIAQPGEKALRRSTSANPWSVMMSGS